MTRSRVWLACAAGIAAMVLTAACGNPTVDVIEGYVTSVNQNGAFIGLAESPESPEAEGYIVAGADWRDAGGAWHDTFPTCLEPLSSGDRVRLGVVDVPPQGDAPGREHVVWLECLGEWEGM